VPLLKMKDDIEQRTKDMTKPIPTGGGGGQP